jgi:hypothetical protein
LRCLRRERRLVKEVMVMKMVIMTMVLCGGDKTRTTPDGNLPLGRHCVGLYQDGGDG